MPINPERLHKLAEVGLTEHQARAYLALLDVGSATVKDLAKSSRVPRSKLYEVLDSLNRRGLLEVIPDTPQRFRARAITTLYDTRTEELRAEEDRLKRRVAKLAIELQPSTRADGGEAERDFAAVIRGRVNFLSRVRQLLESTEDSLVVVGGADFLARFQGHTEHLRAMHRLADQGKLRVLVPKNVLRKADGRRIPIEDFEGFVRTGEFAGSGASVYARDASELLLVRFVPNDLHPSQGQDRIVVVNDPEVAGLHAQWFEIGWRGATPLETPRR
jgi:sugar-specific transcriptional regulator TrmB